MNPHNRLSNYIVEVPKKLSALSYEELTGHVPGKWSRKQVLGHLIDSAINNLKRFTDAQFAPEPYQVIPYNQNQLVVINRYQDLPVEHLLSLWASLNQQILFVANGASAETLDRKIKPGNDNQATDSCEIKTLGWLIEDYVIHLEHHLKTLL
ncbi:DinB family protein [Spirosoma harenae]